ncbi:anthranilate synthase component 1 [Candidatus Woesearchaeota archaeon]|nr:anthranilate synthase component 1 [Candidatus Woesearchaeota archaeon]
MKLETVYKIVQGTADPVGLFRSLKQHTKHAFLLESADHVKKYGEKSIGCVNPSLCICIKNSYFKIEALNPVGEQMLLLLKSAFSTSVSTSGSMENVGSEKTDPSRRRACHRSVIDGGRFSIDTQFSSIEADGKILRGTIPENKKHNDEEERLQHLAVFNFLRKIAFAFVPTLKLQIPFCGLFGAISYDAIDYVEKLPRQQQQENEIPDFLFYYATELFVMDHLQNKTYLLASVPEGTQKQYLLMDALKRYESAMKIVPPYLPPSSTQSYATVSEDDATFIKKVEQMQEHIRAGDVFQCVLSRTFSIPSTEDHLGIYARLKAINPGPYMFFMENAEFTLLGSSPETCLKVTGEKHKIAEIKPIAGTLPRGKSGNAIDADFDSRLELDLLLDPKELAEHCMLVDLARNDIARISIPGTRTATKLLEVEKYSHVQHLVSTVQGTLRSDIDALHAYAATMNMGTLTGAPKIKAMELIRRYEQTKRGFYGGAVCYLTPAGDFDSCIVIRAIVLQGGMAQVRSGAGIVYDSVPEREAEETKKKAAACLAALGVEP